MTDKAQKHAAWATMHLTVVFVSLSTATLIFAVAFNQYVDHQTADVVVAMLMTLVAALNLVLFVARIIQMVDEIRHPEPEIDEELERAYDQLAAEGFVFDGDEIVRDDDGQLYLCLDNGGASSIDLLLVESYPGRWRLYVPGEEETPMPMKHVGALRERLRQQDEQLVSELKGLST